MKKDELCKCGHLKSEHNDNIGMKGHGSCSRVECYCSKFTWKQNIEREETILDKFR